MNQSNFIKTILSFTISILLVGCDDIQNMKRKLFADNESNQKTTLGSNENTSKTIKIDSKDIILGRRVALLIANEDYETAPLKNPINDANLLARSLEKQGFKVTILKNSDRANMVTAVDEFAQDAKNAESAVFYYSGHGLQDSNRNNYLIPINARISGESSIKGFGLNAYNVVDALEKAKARVSLIILDACRNNPFKGVRGSEGLASMEIPESQMLVSFATRSGSFALDASPTSEGNSPYAFAISRAIESSENKPLLSLFDDVAEDVKKATNKKQKPTRSGDMRADTYLILNSEPKTNEQIEKTKEKIEKVKTDKPKVDEATKIKTMVYEFYKDYAKKHKANLLSSYKYDDNILDINLINKINEIEELEEKLSKEADSVLLDADPILQVQDYVDNIRVDNPVINGNNAEIKVYTDLHNNDRPILVN